MKNIPKDQVKNYWNEASCGEDLFLKGKTERERFENQMQKRYELEPYIIPFADFSQWKGKKVLEIGVGLGADHQMFAQNDAQLTGVDLTERAVAHTQERLKVFNLTSELSVGDAENLIFEDNQFDLVYSWGVIHHSPDMAEAIKEIYRVLKPGGKARIMIYHKYSLVGFMLWLRYAFLRGKLTTSLKEIYERYLESPGTKAFTKKEAREKFSLFNIESIDIELSHADLLSPHAGQRHQGALLDKMRAIYPENFVKKYCKEYGLFMLLRLKKPE